MTGPLIIIVGILIALAGIITTIHTEEPTLPKVNEHRIVKFRDGTYAIQYYWKSPGWHSFKTTYDSLDDAQRTLNILDGKDKAQSPYDVIEVFPKAQP